MTAATTDAAPVHVQPELPLRQLPAKPEPRPRTTNGGSTSAPVGSACGAWPWPGPGSIGPTCGDEPGRSTGSAGDRPVAPPDGPSHYGRAHADRCRAPRLPARGQAAHPQLRRPRPLPRRHRGGLRRPPRGDRHQRLTDRPRPLGPRVGLAVPRRRHRGPADPQRRARPLPMGADHPGSVAARRGRGVSPHRDRRLGPRRSGRGAARVPRPGGAGRPVGIRHQPPRPPTSTPCCCGPEFFDVYLELAVDFALPLRLLGPESEPNVGFPVRQLASDEGVLFADRFGTLATGRQPPGLPRTARRISSPASPS